MFARGFIAGVCAALLAIVAIGLGAKAFSREGSFLECGKAWLGLNTVSHHIDPGRSYNEQNWGMFYECRRSREWRWQTGYYLNSYQRDTFYAWAHYQPIHRGWLGGMKFGGFFGLGTGYNDREEVRRSNGDTKDVPRDGLSVLGGLMATWEPHRDFGANLLVAKTVIALQLKVNW